jgi:hypothetical protein
VIFLHLPIGETCFRQGELLYNHYSILSIKNGNDNDNVPIEDNCLEEERSDDSKSKYCLRPVHCH